MNRWCRWWTKTRTCSGRRGSSDSSRSSTAGPSSTAKSSPHRPSSLRLPFRVQGLGFGGGAQGFRVQGSGFGCKVQVFSSTEPRFRPPSLPRMFPFLGYGTRGDRFSHLCGEDVLTSPGILSSRGLLCWGLGSRFWGKELLDSNQKKSIRWRTWTWWWGWLASLPSGRASPTTPISSGSQSQLQQALPRVSSSLKPLLIPTWKPCTLS